MIDLRLVWHRSSLKYLFKNLFVTKKCRFDLRRKLCLLKDFQKLVEELLLILILIVVFELFFVNFRWRKNNFRKFLLNRLSSFIGFRWKFRLDRFFLYRNLNLFARCLYREYFALEKWILLYTRDQICFLLDWSCYENNCLFWRSFQVILIIILVEIGNKGLFVSMRYLSFLIVPLLFFL